jgi:translation initiation factor IF-3
MSYNKYDRDRKRDNDTTRVNFQIKSPTVRLVKDGQQIGIFVIDKARKMAQEAELDLVEIAPKAVPPVCAIMDYSKFKYEQQIKDKENKRKQRESQVEIKEIRLRPMIDAHDIETKVAQAKRFLSEGKKVQFNLVYKGSRELSHKEQGLQVVNRILAELTDVADVEKAPKIEGSRLMCRLDPKPNKSELKIEPIAS